MNYLFIGGSKGIGLEVTKNLVQKGHCVYVASRSADELPEGCNHISFDVLNDEINIDQLPEVLDGFCYFPGSINLKPFSSLSRRDFEKDLSVNFLPLPTLIQKILPRLKKAQQASLVFFSTVAVQTC